MSLRAPAISQGLFGPERRNNKRSRRAKNARVGDGAEACQPPFPLHAVCQLVPGGINSFLESDHYVFLSGRPNLQPGNQVTQITINGHHQSDTGGNRDLAALQGQVQRSISTLRSVTIRGTNGKDTSGIVAALLPSRWRVVPNLVSLELSDIADSSTGTNPIRKIGEAIETLDQLPSLEKLTFRNCRTLERDIGPLAAALRRGNARELRALSCCNQHGNLGAVTDLLLEALANGARPRPRVQALSFADNRTFAGNPLLHLRGALEACPKLRTLRLDCTMTPAPELRVLATSINKGQQPLLEYVFVRVPAVMSDHMPTRGAAEYLSYVAEQRDGDFRLEMELD